MLLKAASKHHQHNKHLLHKQLRSVTSHQVYRDKSLVGEARRDILDTYCEVDHHVGYLKMNREHRYNTLTPNFIREIRRSLETLNCDDVVKVIYMTGGKGQHFTNGTDFRTLLHYKAKGETEKYSQYLADLYGLQISVAQLNKPLIAVAHGHSFNSGAALLQATGMPTVTPDSKLAFNEVTYGFVPHGGSSFYLSRLPGELGTFLALTGLPISGVDAMGMKIADELVHTTKTYETLVSDIMMAMEFPIPNGYQKGSFNTEVPWVKHMQAKKSAAHQEYLNDTFEMTRKKMDHQIHEEFVEPKDKHPSTIAESDLKYKEMMRKYNKEQGFAEDPSFLEYDNGLNTNYYAYILDYIKSHSGNEYTRHASSLVRESDIINRCFYPNSVEEIMHNLQIEAQNSQFAKMCLEKMNQNSMLSMKLTLKMLRQAKGADYKGCLQNELNVALNKIQDSEFDLGIQEILFKPAKSLQPVNPGFAPSCSDDQVLSYFQPNKHLSSIHLDVVEQSLLPTRKYYQTYTDHVRLWINETSTTQPEIREHFDLELREGLREIGIDLRDRALTIESARKQIYQREYQERMQQEFDTRMDALVKDTKLRDRYFDKINKEVENLDSNPGEFYKKVNGHIQDIFEKAYMEKLSIIYEKSKEARSLEKRRMFIRFKQFLFQSRILTFANEDFDRLMKQVQGLPYKLPHLTEQWDGKDSWRSLSHPEIHQSPLWQLSKVIGRANMTPPELAKQYMSNPDMAKQMNLFTFNQEELKKLRRDLLQNPEKYELLFRKDNGTFQEKGKKSILDLNADKIAEYDYWYRVTNQDRLQEDSFPYQKEYLAYKDWVETIETKGLNTLRMIVQKLLNEYENSDNKEFIQQKGDTKNASLQNLLKLVNDYEPAEQTKKLTKKSKNTDLAPKNRSQKDIKAHINKLIEEDQHISKLIPQENASNPLVNATKQNLMNELYQLVEFVLLNTTQNKEVPRELIQERLQALANPSSADQAGVTSLRVIDTYLSDKNTEYLVKEAINLSKPYFFNQILPKLEEEARKVFNSVKIEATSENVMFFYMYNINHPEARTSEIINKIRNYHEDRDREAYYEQTYGITDSHKYAMKSMMQMLGSNYQLDRSMSIADQENQLKQQVLAEQKDLKKMEAYPLEQEEQWTKETEEQRQKMLSKPFNHENPDAEVDYFPKLNPHALTKEEFDQVLNEYEKAQRITNYIQDNHALIKASMKTMDWLHVYSKAVTEYGMDMQSMFRQAFEGSRYTERDFGKEAQQEFGKEVDWQGVAEYSGWLSELYKQGYEAWEGKGAQERFEKISDKMVQYMGTLDGEEAARQASVFQMLRDRKQVLGGFSTKDDRLRTEITDFVSLQQNVLRHSKLRDSILLLADQAPKATRELVSDLLNSQSELLNLTKLENLLQKKEYSRISTKFLIDKELIVKEMKTSQSLQGFIKGYGETKLDVVSLAQARQIVYNSYNKEDKTSKVGVGFAFNEKLHSQVLAVLDHLDTMLEYVPNSRRAELSLGEFFKRHHYVNAASLQAFGTEVLQRKLEEMMGAQNEDVQAADIIDWEFAGYRTQPLTHIQEDTRVLSALQEGKGTDPIKQLDKFVENTIAMKIEPDENAMGVKYWNEVNGEYEMAKEKDYEYEIVLREAKELTDLKPEFKSLKNYYENLILSAYSQNEFDQNKVEKLIHRYTELRLKDCMLNDKFAVKVKSNNGHIYVKMLKEKIAEELRLDREAELSEFAHGKINFEDQYKVDPNGKYSLSNLNNLDAMGYDNLSERAANPAQNRELAHETVFDKMIAQYFLQKRGQYVATNDLIDQLDKHFNKPGYDEGHKYKANDSKQIDQSSIPWGDSANMTYQYLKQNIGKNDIPRIKPQDYTELMELDIAVQQQLQNNKNGLSQNLRQDIIPDDALMMPEHFEMLDVRKPAAKHVDDKLRGILDQIFHARSTVEKTMSKNELIAYDKVLLNYLTHEVLMPKVKTEIEQDYLKVHQLQQAYEQHHEGTYNEHMQHMKTPNTQRTFDKSIKNEDALYKFLAYTGMLEKKRREDIMKTRKDEEQIFGVDCFDEFYKKQLQEDAQKPAREIDMTQFQPKKGIDQSKIDEGFMTRAQKEEAYWKDYELFKENKKEQMERNQVFFILEQFFAKAKQQPNPMDKAQEAIEDYFRDTENTFFFDKNKIQ